MLSLMPLIAATLPLTLMLINVISLSSRHYFMPMTFRHDITSLRTLITFAAMLTRDDIRHFHAAMLRCCLARRLRHDAPVLLYDIHHYCHADYDIY